MGWSSLHVVVYCCCKGPHLQAVELVQAKDRELAQARQQLKQTKVNSKSHMCCKSVMQLQGEQLQPSKALMDNWRLPETKVTTCCMSLYVHTL